MRVWLRGVTLSADAALATVASCESAAAMTAPVVVAATWYGTYYC